MEVGVYQLIIRVSGALLALCGCAGLGIVIYAKACRRQKTPLPIKRGLKKSRKRKLKRPEQNRLPNQIGNLSAVSIGKARSTQKPRSQSKHLARMNSTTHNEEPIYYPHHKKKSQYGADRETSSTKRNIKKHIGKTHSAYDDSVYSEINPYDSVYQRQQN